LTVEVHAEAFLWMVCAERSVIILVGESGMSQLPHWVLGRMRLRPHLIQAFCAQDFSMA
jgi:hypothetical protein